jgi:hypothetical protein
MALNFFDMIKEICYHKSNLDFDNPEIYSAYNVYMINRYLSMVEMFVPFVMMVNNSKISKKDHYEFFKNLIPKRYYDFDYIKKEIDKDLELKIKCVCEYFEIGKREAEIYLKDFINDKEIEKIMEIYKYGKNGKKSILNEKE